MPCSECTASPRRGAEYYLADLAQELPLPQLGEEGGLAVWSGRAAEGLGLRGAIDPEPPAGGPRRPPSDIRPSAAIGASHRPRIRPDLQRAEVGERRVRVGRRGGGPSGRDRAPPGRAGRAALHRVARALGASGARVSSGRSCRRRAWWRASFTHGVNRNLDPHLHTHVVMANMVHGLDGRWGACDHRGLSAHRVAAAAVYESHLRVELTSRLGIRWVEAPGLRAEVDGVSPLLLGEFSSRSADIRRHMAEHGAHSARGARVAWAATRPDKRAGLDFGRAVVPVGTAGAVVWQSSRRNGRDPRVAPGAHPAVEAVDEHRFGAMLSLAPDGAARRRDVVAAFATAAVDGADEHGLDQLTRLWTPTLVRSRAGGCRRGHAHLAQCGPGRPSAHHARATTAEPGRARQCGAMRRVPSTATADVGG